MFGHNTYDEDVKPFKKILVADAEQLLSTEDLVVIYIGRSTCPFCCRFVKTLNGLASKINTPIYYIESDNPLDAEISDFRAQYDIVTVPGFLVMKNKEVKVLCDSSTPESELLDMLK